MLQRFIQEFLTYCRLADFSDRSIQALTARLKELQSFLKARRIRPVKKITNLDLGAFVAYFNNPSIHVRKSRVWTLRQFYHFWIISKLVGEICDYDEQKSFNFGLIRLYWCQRERLPVRLFETAA